MCVYFSLQFIVCVCKEQCLLVIRIIKNKQCPSVYCTQPSPLLLALWNDSQSAASAIIHILYRTADCDVLFMWSEQLSHASVTSPVQSLFQVFELHCSFITPRDAQLDRAQHRYLRFPLMLILKLWLLCYFIAHTHTLKPTGEYFNVFSGYGACCEFVL